MSDVSSVTSSVSSLTSQTAQPYSVSASVSSDGSTIDTSTSTTTGSDPALTSASSSSTSASSGLGENDFLQLLVTQMQNQDPTAPTDDTEYISELAQFSALEGNNNIVSAVNNLGTSFKSATTADQDSAQSISNSAAVGMIGKTVTMQQSTVNWDGVPGDAANINVQLGDTTGATVQLLDSSGNVVKTLTTSGADANNNTTVSWDGSEDNGTTAPAGTYTISIQGASTDSSVYSFVQNTVTGVKFDSTGALLTVGGQDMSIGSVLAVDAGSSAAENQTLSPTSAVALLGKTVQVKLSQVQYTAGSNVSFLINGGSNSQVPVNIEDGSGNVVYSGYANVTNGVATVNWDGSQTGGGARVSSGTYYVSVPGSDTDPSLYAYTQGTVQGISNVGGNSTLQVSGTTGNVNLSDIIDISSSSSS